MNTAYVGPMSTALQNFRAQQEEIYLKEGDHYKIKAYEDLEHGHAVMASFFNASRAQTFGVFNFSTGIRWVLDALPKNYRFLTLEEDYPSLRFAIEERGFSTATLPISEHLESEIDKQLSTGAFEVLAFSMVQYISGYKMDLDFLKKIKEKYPQVLLITDGTQFLGAHAFDFNNSPIDAVVASGYKWLLAGFGNGIIMLSDGFLKHSLWSAQQFYDKIFTGHFDILATASIRFALQQLEEMDFDQLLKQKASLTSYFKTTLQEHQLLDSRKISQKQDSSIFSIPGDEKMYQALLDQNIRCAMRGSGIRFSVHFYNQEDDIHRLVDFLKSYKS